MIEKTYGVPLKKNQRIFIWTLGDIGFSGNRYSHKAMQRDQEFLTREKQAGNVVKIVGLGDYLAFPSPSERAAIVSAKSGKGLYDTTLEAWDSDSTRRCEEWLVMMEPFKRDFLGILTGHHVYDYSRQSVNYGLNSDQYLAKKLKCDYYGTIAFIRLVIGSHNFDILAHHGYGSGRTIGAKIIKRARVLEGFNPHLVVMGHDNTRIANCQVAVKMGEKGVIVHEDRYALGSGAYEMAYQSGKIHPGYVEEGLMNPCPLGASFMLIENCGNELFYRAIV